MFAMSGDGKDVDDVNIPVVFLFSLESAELMKAINAAAGDLTVTIGIVYYFLYLLSWMNLIFYI